MKIRTQWELWKEINEEKHFPQDHWDEKWVNINDLKELFNGE